MKVVFIKELEGQGKRGEIREAKPGYVRNFLMPKGFVVLAGDVMGKQIINQVEAEKAKIETETEELKVKLEELQDLKLQFAKKITGKGKLFATVKSEDIAKEFTKKTKLEVVAVDLPEPIKEAGEQSVGIHLKHGLSLFVTVVVVAEK